MCHVQSHTTCTARQLLCTLQPFVGQVSPSVGYPCPTREALPFPHLCHTGSGRIRSHKTDRRSRRGRTPCRWFCSSERDRQVPGCQPCMVRSGYAWFVGAEGALMRVKAAAIPPTADNCPKRNHGLTRSWRGRFAGPHTCSRTWSLQSFKCKCQDSGAAGARHAHSAQAAGAGPGVHVNALCMRHRLVFRASVQWTQASPQHKHCKHATHILLSRFGWRCIHQRCR